MLSGELDRLLGLGEGEGIGAFVGMSGWLPFWREIEHSLEDAKKRKNDVVKRYVRGLLQLDAPDGEGGGEKCNESGSKVETVSLSTPMLLCHGRQDEKLKLRLGDDMFSTFRKVGMDVEFKTYEGLEHWYNGQEMRDIVQFLYRLWDDPGQWRNHEVEAH